MDGLSSLLRTFSMFGLDATTYGQTFEVRALYRDNESKGLRQQWRRAYKVQQTIQMKLTVMSPALASRALCRPCTVSGILVANRRRARRTWAALGRVTLDLNHSRVDTSRLNIIRWKEHALPRQNCETCSQNQRNDVEQSRKSCRSPSNSLHWSRDKQWHIEVSHWVYGGFH